MNRAEAEAARDGAQVSLSASLDALLGQMTTHQQSHADAQDGRQRRSRLLRMVTPIPITAPQIPLAAGAGVLNNMPDLLGPHDGYAWAVSRLTANSFTAGTVTAYLNFQADENQLVTWTQAGSFFFGSNALILGDSDTLIFVASGITGNVTISGQAVQVPTQLLPDYLL